MASRFCNWRSGRNSWASNWRSSTSQARRCPTAGETLAYIGALGHANLYLLYDSGHILLSGEDPATVILNAGDRLGYVHFDDNDGSGDLHWSLLEGVMTEESLYDTVCGALQEIGYCRRAEPGAEPEPAQSQRVPCATAAIFCCGRCIAF